MNYMKQVAQMLGVELDEEFKLKDFNTGCIKCHQDYDDNLIENIYKITKYTILMRYANDSVFFTDKQILIDILNGKYEVVKLPKPTKPILDEVEKKYLSRVIRPWRDKIYHMTKMAYGECEYITVKYDDGDKDQEMPFPNFIKGTMYKGMELEREYTLEELGL